MSHKWYKTLIIPIDGVLLITIDPQTSFPESLHHDGQEWIKQSSFYLDTPTAPYSTIILVYARIPYGPQDA